MTLYLGIDGGGTRCRARLSNDQGQILGQGLAGSANIMLGPAKALQAIMDATREALTQAGLGNESMKHIQAGLALAGAEHSGFAADFLALEHPFAQIKLDTDAMGALLGAFEGQDGAIMIFGTGSAGLLKQGNRFQSVGGHEFPISDLGGGATLGLEVIRASLLSFEGILPASALATQVMHQFDQDIEALVSWSKTALPTDYGQFAKPCFDWAEQGDELAQSLVDKQLADCRLMLSALQAKGAERIALMGSIGERLLPVLQQDFDGLVPAQQDAQYGALLLAGLSADKLSANECSLPR